MRKAMFVVISMLASMSPAPASAQSVTVPTRIDVGCGFNLPNATAELTSAYRRADGAAFRRHLTAVLDAINTDCRKVSAAGINPSRHVLHVLWVDMDPLGKQEVVNHVVLQRGDDDLANTTLPGVTSADDAFEIFLADGEKDAIATVYASTRERDPLDEQLPAFAKAIADPLTALLAGTQALLIGRAAARPSVPPPPGAASPTHFATVSRIELPYARARVHVEVRVAVARDAGGVSRDITRLSTQNAFATGAHAPCAQALNSSLKAIVDSNAGTCTTTPAECVEKVTPAFNGAYQAAEATCANEAQRRELLAVDASYREFVKGLTGANLSASYDLRNSPRRLASLGLMTAYAFAGGIKGAMRVKVKDGKIVADPLDRRLNLVVVNFAFKPYNADAFHPTAGERLRWFAGAVVTPDFGGAIGLSAGIVRGLTVNVGGAILGVRGMHADDTLGEPPTHDEDPFRLSHARVLFLGVGYNFK